MEVELSKLQALNTFQFIEVIIKNEKNEKMKMEMKMKSKMKKIKKKRK